MESVTFSRHCSENGEASQFMPVEDPAAAPDEALERDPVIEAYKAHVDRSLLREQLRRPVDERVRNMIASLRFAESLRRAGRDRGTP
jgi:hypothetical protein